MRTLRAYAYTLDNITKKIEFGQKNLMGNITKLTILQSASNQETGAIEACQLDAKATLATRAMLLACANEALTEINSILSGNNLNTNNQTNNNAINSGTTTQQNTTQNVVNSNTNSTNTVSNKINANNNTNNQTTNSNGNLNTKNSNGYVITPKSSSMNTQNNNNNLVRQNSALYNNQSVTTSTEAFAIDNSKMEKSKVRANTDETQKMTKENKKDCKTKNCEQNKPENPDITKIQNDGENKNSE